MSEVSAKPAWLSRLPMDTISMVGQRFGVDPFLIAAICQTESSGRQYAQRFEPGYRWFFDVKSCAESLGCSVDTERSGQQSSYGLMQVMGAVMREYGFKGWFGQAFDPEINIEFGTKHLAQFIKRYPPRIESAISAYNAGSPRYQQHSVTFENQEYVDKVMGFWKQAKGEAK